MNAYIDRDVEDTSQPVVAEIYKPGAHNTICADFWDVTTPERDRCLCRVITKRRWPDGLLQSRCARAVFDHENRKIKYAHRKGNENDHK